MTGVDGLIAALDRKTGERPRIRNCGHLSPVSSDREASVIVGSICGPIVSEKQVDDIIATSIRHSTRLVVLSQSLQLHVTLPPYSADVGVARAHQVIAPPFEPLRRGFRPHLCCRRCWGSTHPLTPDGSAARAPPARSRDPGCRQKSERRGRARLRLGWLDLALASSGPENPEWWPPGQRHQSSLRRAVQETAEDPRSVDCG